MERETTGFRFVGSGNAYDSLNDAVYPTGKDDLQTYAKYLRGITTLPYYTATIPGSVAGSTDASGGALGIQMMPDNAVHYTELYTTANDTPAREYPAANVFDPFTGAVLSYLFLADKGYKAGDDNAKFDALWHWNQSYDEVYDCLNSGNSYYRKFGRPEVESLR